MVLGAELPDRVGVAVRGDADHMHVGVDVDSRRVFGLTVTLSPGDGGGDFGDGEAISPATSWPRLASWAFLAFFGSSFGTTMDGLRLAGAGDGNNKAPRAKRGIGDVCSLPNGINTTPGQPGMASRQ